MIGIVKLSIDCDMQVNVYFTLFNGFGRIWVYNVNSTEAAGPSVTFG